MSGIDEQMLMAFVDGELDEVNRARVERAAVADPALAGAIAEQRHVREWLAGHYAPIADEPVPERLQSMLESKIVPLPPKMRQPYRLGWRELSALAATFVAGVLGAQLVRPAPQQNPVGGGPLYASAGLARTLDTQLASAQPPGAPIRIGVSFAARDGRLCRTFESGALAGLACRGGDKWEVMTAVRLQGSGTGEYRQAGSVGAPVMQVAQEMMVGPAFDATAERRARDAGWRSGR
jgi:hypothetical protein